MTHDKRKYKIRYIIFILTVVITIIANDAILRYNLSLQDSDAAIINTAGRQRMLSQRISKHLLLWNDSTYGIDRQYTIKQLGKLTAEFNTAQAFLKSNNRDKHHNAAIDSLFQVVEPDFITMVNASKEVTETNDSLILNGIIKTIINADRSFLHTMEHIVALYQKDAETRLANTKRIALLLSIVSILVLVGEFVFIVLPFFKDLFRQNKTLLHANRRLSDFAHIASHNLRAPIVNLNMLLEFVNTTKDPMEKVSLMDKFKTTLTHLNSTMNTLVEALKTQSDTSTKIEDIRFNSIFDQTRQTLSGQILESDADIQCDFSKAPNLPYNRIYLESIFQNLLTNALKYRSPERIPRIFVSSEIKNGKTHLSVSDNGLGINMKRHKEKLFGLNKVFHRHPDAHGIGLFMTRIQIESLGGTITAESEENKGSTFKVIF